MDVKLSDDSSNPKFTGKHLDFCDNLSEHGYGSLEDLQTPSTPLAQSCDPPSPSFLESSLSSSSSADSIANLNLDSSSDSAHPSSQKECNSSQTTHGIIDDQNNNRVNNDLTKDPGVLNCNNKEKQFNTGDIVQLPEGTKYDDQNDKISQSQQQQYQSGNRFRFVPKNRQNTFNGDRQSNKPTNYNRGGNRRRNTRSESDCDTKSRSTPIRYKNNEDIVFIVRKVDRSLRRTVSESSGETLPVRGILKYPRDWDRRTLSESSYDNSTQSNLMETGRTQSLECISPELEASCEASTESACSLTTESPGHDEEKPKKSVHFNCYVSKATFNIHSTILNNKQQHGSNKKKNRRRDNSNNNKSNSSNSIVNLPNKSNNTKQPQFNDRLKSQQPHHHLHQPSEPSNCPSDQQPNPNRERIVSPSKRNNNPDKRSVNNETEELPIKENDASPVDFDDKEDQSENVDPMETKMRSRQDSGYDSETSDRKGIEIAAVTCVKSPKRKFTVKKVDLNQ